MCIICSHFSLIQRKENFECNVDFLQKIMHVASFNNLFYTFKCKHFTVLKTSPIQTDYDFSFITRLTVWIPRFYPCSRTPVLRPGLAPTFHKLYQSIHHHKPTFACLRQQLPPARTATSPFHPGSQSRVTKSRHLLTAPPIPAILPICLSKQRCSVIFPHCHASPTSSINSPSDIVHRISNIHGNEQSRPNDLPRNLKRSGGPTTLKDALVPKSPPVLCPAALSHLLLTMVHATISTKHLANHVAQNALPDRFVILANIQESPTHSLFLSRFLDRRNCQTSLPSNRAQYYCLTDKSHPLPHPFSQTVRPNLLAPADNPNNIFKHLVQISHSTVSPHQHANPTRITTSNDPFAPLSPLLLASPPCLPSSDHG